MVGLLSPFMGRFGLGASAFALAVVHSGPDCGLSPRLCMLAAPDLTTLVVAPFP